MTFFVALSPKQPVRKIKKKFKSTVYFPLSTLIFLSLCQFKQIKPLGTRHCSTEQRKVNKKLLSERKMFAYLRHQLGIIELY